MEQFTLDGHKISAATAAHKQGQAHQPHLFDLALVAPSVPLSSEPRPGRIYCQEALPGVAFGANFPPGRLLTGPKRRIPMTTPNPAAFWSACLDVLALKLARAVFDNWLAGSVGVALSSQTLTVAVRNQYAKDWLTGRLHPVLLRVARAEYAASGNDPDAFALNIVVQDRVPTPNDTNRPELAPDLSQPVAVELVEFDPRQFGFVQISGYAWRFWLPYLGRDVFVTWGILKSYAYAAELGGEWPALPTLAACLRSDPQTLTGRTRRGVWVTGWLETLELERILWRARNDRGRYVYRLLASLPLLAPAQVLSLPDGLQRLHNDYLTRFEVNRSVWASATAPTFCPNPAPDIGGGLP